MTITLVEQVISIKREVEEGENLKKGLSLDYD